MDAVDILLVCLVGFSVLVFFIVENLEESRKPCDETNESRVIYDSKRKTATGRCLLESVKARDGRGVEKTSCAVAEADRESLVSGSIVKDVGDQREDGFFDDWEGIERTELEKVFGEAVVFVSCKSNADGIDEDVKLQLYGLQKIALEGTCHESQPMALKLSARAKWNAWKQLGSMNREMAMEEYVNILAQAIPGWKAVDAGANIDPVEQILS
ncbi:UNVERIFIED_CONTAM: Acyl-CoA-binding domain-containing protein 3 [Sesamum angustifolium]|uniref:Acyl-CoA-binding domain-containing protein 3 n=1 Tax=Sesamum angustifolium TaxID=2727405 RepID=A0AAW2NM31_9LAMI